LSKRFWLNTTWMIHGFSEKLAEKKCSQTITTEIPSWHNSTFFKRMWMEILTVESHSNTNMRLCWQTQYVLSCLFYGRHSEADMESKQHHQGRTPLQTWHKSGISYKLLHLLTLFLSSTSTLCTETIWTQLSH
jgi:hypothetical protein